jgi:hypothetical protein
LNDLVSLVIDRRRIFTATSSRALIRELAKEGDLR